MEIFVLLGFSLVLVTVVTSRSTIDRVAVSNYKNLIDGDEDHIKRNGIDQVNLVRFLDDEGNEIQFNTEESLPTETLLDTLEDLSESVNFFLYTRKNPTSFQQLYIDDKETLARSNFDDSKPTNFITHGWIASSNSTSCTLIREAYLSNGDFNVILVDWSTITKRPYVWASSHVKIVGIFVAAMIDFLEEQGMDTFGVTLVGHSLGAHVMGIAGYQSINSIGVIVGLDPALPLFATSEPGSRISQNDAIIVQIIHTNAGLLGFEVAIGDADFYPNGGHKQPGCTNDLTSSCAHSRSFEYFAESIVTSVGFYGTYCQGYAEFKKGVCSDNDVALMGGVVLDSKANGTYFLRTNDEYPYAKGAVN